VEAQGCICYVGLKDAFKFPFLSRPTLAWHNTHTYLSHKKEIMLP